MHLTTKEKLKILELSKTLVVAFRGVGLCTIICTAYSRIHNEPFKGDMHPFDYIPELVRFRPVPVVGIYNEYWWPITDRQVRQDCLDSLIEEIKLKETDELNTVREVPESLC